MVTTLGLLFPGQGSQYPGMGRDLFDAFEPARRVFEEADEALGQPISNVCFDGSEADLALTENTQPAILTVSIAALRALEAEGMPAAVAAAGHSLGEYSAHVAAGSFDLAAAVKTVRARGQFMQEAVPVGVGAMAAVIGMDVPEVEQICAAVAGDEVVSPANMNSPGQVVIAGHASAIARAEEAAQQEGARKVARLPVSAPFHCSLMHPAARRLSDVLDRVEVVPPRIPVYANVDASRVTTASATRSTLVQQVASPVRWIDVVRAMLADGVGTFIEIGPGRVLSGLVRRIDRDARVVSVSDAEGVGRAIDALKGEV